MNRVNHVVGWRDYLYLAVQVATLAGKASRTPEAGMGHWKVPIMQDPTKGATPVQGETSSSLDPGKRAFSEWGRKLPALGMEKGNASGDGGLLTVDELAARLRVKPSWVYTHADDLGGYRLGKYLRFSWARVIERLEHGTGTR